MRSRFLVNATLGSTLNSPLESPDIMQTFLPLCDAVAKNASLASIKLSSADSINVRNQQVRPIRVASTHVTQFPPYTSCTPQQHQYYHHIPNTNAHNGYHSNGNGNGNGVHYSEPYSSIVTCRTIPSVIEETVLEVPELVTISRSNSPATTATATTAEPEEEAAAAVVATVLPPQRSCEPKPMTLNFQVPQTRGLCMRSIADSAVLAASKCPTTTLAAGGRLLDFRINSVGRSFIDTVIDTEDALTCTSLCTPETPTPNISPSSSNRFSEAGFNDGDGDGVSHVAPSTPSIVVSPMLERPASGVEHTVRPSASFNLCGSWDLLELDMDFHDVNFDPSYGGDVEECIYFDGDDPFGLLPVFPTPPDAIDL